LPPPDPRPRHVLWAPDSESSTTVGLAVGRRYRRGVLPLPRPSAPVASFFRNEPKLPKIRRKKLFCNHLGVVQFPDRSPRCHARGRFDRIDLRIGPSLRSQSFSNGFISGVPPAAGRRLSRQEPCPDPRPVRRWRARPPGPPRGRTLFFDNRRPCARRPLVPSRSERVREPFLLFQANRMAPLTLKKPAVCMTRETDSIQFP
jgi:hypothetical protein